MQPIKELSSAAGWCPGRSCALIRQLANWRGWLQQSQQLLDNKTANYLKHGILHETSNQTNLYSRPAWFPRLSYKSGDSLNSAAVQCNRTTEVIVQQLVSEGGSTGVNNRQVCFLNFYYRFFLWFSRVKPVAVIGVVHTLSVYWLRPLSFIGQPSSCAGLTDSIQKVPKQ